MTDGLLEDAIRKYTARGIKDLYGLNLIEFLELPMDIIEVLFKISNEELSKRSSTLDGIERDFNKIK